MGADLIVILEYNPKTNKGKQIDLTERATAIEKYMKVSDLYRMIPANPHDFNTNFREKNKLNKEEKSQSLWIAWLIQRIIGRKTNIKNKQTRPKMSKLEMVGIIISIIVGLIFIGKFIYEVFIEKQPAH